MGRRRLRLLSWNIQWGRGRDGRVDLARMAGAARRFDADILCLQEVAVHHPELPGGAPGNQPEFLAAMFHGYEAIYGVGSDIGDGAGGRRQFGELVLSRLPVLQVFRHALPWPADPAVPSMPRVALEAVVDTPVGFVRVLTTHLEFYSPLQRTAQIEALRAIHVEGWRHARRPRSSAETDPPFAVLPRGEVTILCGDFNFVPGAPEHRRLQAPFDGGESDVPSLADAWTLAHPQRPHAPTAGLLKTDWIAEPACCDFFFLSENAAGMVAGLSVDTQVDASDHQPLVLDLFIPDAE